LLRVTQLELRNFRNYERLGIALGDGLTVVHGAVGAGKTNLLEGLYVGCTGRSPKRAADRELVRFGERAAHVSVQACGEHGARTLEVGLEVGRPKVFRADGSAVVRADDATRPLVCVFMPDRLELVKGPAALRRGHIDNFVAALWPSRRSTRAAYTRVLAQRNALLGRIRGGHGSPDALRSWDRELSRHGFELMREREEARSVLAPIFEGLAKELGLEGACRLGYRPRSGAGSADELERELEQRHGADLERGFTTHGPHRDDLGFELDGRNVRRFASQGQQRLTLLALLLAERRVLGESRGEVPLLLLDDVLSELDASRRLRLGESVSAAGQTVLTTADLDAGRSAVNGATFVEVSGGVAR
jgi:DNA replication and repair protein RecF